MSYKRFALAGLALCLLLALLPSTVLLSQDTPAGTPAAFATQSAELDAAMDRIAELKAENEALKATLTAIAPFPATDPVFPAFDPDMEYRLVSTETFEMLVPESFEGGNLKDLDAIVENLDLLGPEFETIGEMLKQNPGLFKMYAYDHELTDGIITNVNVVMEQPLIDLELQQYVTLSRRMLPEAIKVVAEENITLGDYDAVRIINEWEIFPGVWIKQAQYVVKMGRAFYTFTYTTSKESFENWLPVFEHMAESFRMLDS